VTSNDAFFIEALGVGRWALKSGEASPHSLRAVGSALEAKSWRWLLTFWTSAFRPVTFDL